MWEEDKEPCPPIVDSWARGMVPLEEKDKNEEKEEEAIKHEESMEEVSSLEDLDIEQTQNYSETEERYTYMHTSCTRSHVYVHVTAI